MFKTLTHEMIVGWGGGGELKSVSLKRHAAMKLTQFKPKITILCNSAQTCSGQVRMWPFSPMNISYLSTLTPSSDSQEDKDESSKKPLRTLLSFSFDALFSYTSKNY